MASENSCTNHASTRPLGCIFCVLIIMIVILNESFLSTYLHALPLHYTTQQDELQRDLMQERWDLVGPYPTQLRSYVPVLTTYTDSAFPSDDAVDKGLRVALRYEVGRFFAALERFKQASVRKSLDEAYIAYSEMSLHLDRYVIYVSFVVVIIVVVVRNKTFTLVWFVATHLHCHHHLHHYIIYIKLHLTAPKDTCGWGVSTPITTTLSRWKSTLPTFPTTHWFLPIAKRIPRLSATWSYSSPVRKRAKRAF
jgi:hypothetical protein